MLRPLILRSMAGRPAAARRGRCSWSRCATNPQFGAVFFRRSTVQVRNEGGLWDESEKLYPAIGAAPKEHVLQWNFPSGASVSFAHLEHDKTVLNWQGSPMPKMVRPYR
ncbi:hypothetical protein [Rhizobium giardinii]|uniref:hypothetical protein n=1 Tax=Rhizobium giardinii TaxID=56731 RepID=UPI003D6DCB7C